jgi:hypothetical protein
MRDECALLYTFINHFLLHALQNLVKSGLGGVTETINQKTHFTKWENNLHIQPGTVTYQVRHSRQASAESVFRLCSRRRCASTLVLDANVLLQKSHENGLSPETHIIGLHSIVQQIMLVSEMPNRQFTGLEILLPYTQQSLTGDVNSISRY